MNSQNPLKKKEVCNMEDGIGSEKGHEKEPKRRDGVNVNSEEHNGERGREVDPSKRRSALARTPPTGTPSGTPNPRSGPGEKCSAERAASEERRDRESEKRKRQEDLQVENRRLRIQVVGLKEVTRSAPVSPSTDVLDLTWDEATMRSTKKKREEYGSTCYKQMGRDAIATSLGGVIKRIGDEVRVITEVSKERNTRKEVKEAAVKLNNLMSLLTTAESQALFQKLGKGLGDTSTTVEERQADWEKRIGKVEKELKLLKDTNEQLRTENNILRERNAALEGKNLRMKEKIQEMENTPGAAARKMEETMFEGGSYEHFAGVEDLIWPKTMFRAVLFTAESPYEAGKEMDLLVLQENSGADRNSADIMERYPELKGMEGKIGAISVLTKAIEGNGITRESERWIIRVCAENADEDLCDSLVRVREILQKGGRTKIGLEAPKWDMTGDTTSKMLEYIFRESGISCELFTRDNPGPEREIAKRGPAWILKQEGKGYAEALKNLKAKVKPGSTLAKAIRTIRETREGNMVVVLDKDNRHMADDLRKELRRGGDIEILREINGEDTAIIVSGIDRVTSKEEVKVAIGDATGLDASKIKVGDLRATYGGNQAATVNIPRTAVEALLSGGGIRIGLNWCTIREKVGVTRCYRCWQYGHLGKHCEASTDESKLCRKCGEGGHVAKDCNSAEKCLTCKQEGHMAGSGRCPEFRKAVARERLKRKKKRSY